MSDPATIASALEIDGLRVNAHIGEQHYQAIDGISLAVRKGEAHGLVGESGSGKSLTLRAIIGLLPANLTVTSGSIRVNGKEMLGDDAAMRTARGSSIAMVFQEPAIALNPLMKVGRQIVDGVAWRRGLSAAQARELALELLAQVGIAEPVRWVNAYPHQLSGGMRQRVMIASAVACKPDLILCDEPTTALDVTIQAQVLKLFKSMKTELGASLLYVTHDLSVVAEFCDSISVMYAGRIVEQADDLSAMIDTPVHPYTRALLEAVPRIKGPVRQLRGLANSAPPLTARKQDPAPSLREHTAGHRVAPFSDEDESYFAKDEHA